MVGHREGLAWWNFAFLATITIMPFTSSLLGDYSSNPLAVDILAVNLLLAILATRMMLVFARRKDLLAGEIDPREIRPLRERAATIVIVVALSAGLAWLNITAAKYCWLLIPGRAVGLGAQVRPCRRPQQPGWHTWPLASSHRPGHGSRTLAFLGPVPLVVAAELAR